MHSYAIERYANGVGESHFDYLLHPTNYTAEQFEGMFHDCVVAAIEFNRLHRFKALLEEPKNKEVAWEHSWAKCCWSTYMHSAEKTLQLMRERYGFITVTPSVTIPIKVTSNLSDIEDVKRNADVCFSLKFNQDPDQPYEEFVLPRYLPTLRLAQYVQANLSAGEEKLLLLDYESGYELD